MKNEEVLCFSLLLPQNLAFKQQTLNFRVSGSGIMEVTWLGTCGEASFKRLWPRCWSELQSPEGFTGAGGSASKLILVGFTQSEWVKTEQEGSQCFQWPVLSSQAFVTCAISCCISQSGVFHVQDTCVRAWVPGGGNHWGPPCTHAGYHVL